MTYTSPETPPGCSDALDIHTGVWVRVRHLLSSELMAAGVSPMASVVSPSSGTLPPSPARQAELAALSERITAESTVAASIVSPEVYDAYKVARAACSAADAEVARLQTLADQGSEPEGLAEVKATAAKAREALNFAADQATDPANRKAWKAIRVVCALPEKADPGLVYLGDLPGTVLTAIAAALNAKREAAADALRSFLGG